MRLFSHVVTTTTMPVKAASALALTFLAAVSGASAQQYAEFDLETQSLANRVCVTCHGGDGIGNQIVGGPALAGIEPWYLRNQLVGFRNHYRGREDSYIPAYEMQASVARLSDAEIDSVVASISAWPAVDNVPTIDGDVEHGAELYQSCAACHGANGEGNEMLRAPGLTAKDDWYLARQLRLFKSGYRGGHPEDQWGQQMRASVAVLSTDQDINDVLAYINSLQVAQ